MNEIFEIEIDKIQPHPLQGKGAGKVFETKVDYEFAQSIAARGVLQPILLAANFYVNDENEIEMRQIENLGSDVNIVFDKHLLISGHKRLEAAKQAGFKTIHAYFKSYDSLDLIEIDYLESNRHRETNDKEKQGLFLQYKQILCRVAKYKQTKGGRKNEKGENKKVRTMCEPSEEIQKAVEFLEKLGIKVDDKVDKREVLAKASGLSRREADMLLKVEDENYKGNKETKWKNAGLTDKQVDDIMKTWYNVGKEYREEKITLKDAADLVDEIIAKVEKGIGDRGLIIGKTKEVKSEIQKPLCYLSYPITENPNSEKESEIFEKELSKKYEVFNPLKFVRHLESKKNRVLNWLECMEAVLPALCAAKNYCRAGDETLRGDSKGCRIEDTLAIALHKNIFNFKAE